VAILEVKDDYAACSIKHGAGFRPQFMGSLHTFIARLQRAFHGEDYRRRRQIDRHLRATDRKSDRRLRDSGQPQGRGLRRLDTFSLSDLDYVEFYAHGLKTELVCYANAAARLHRF